MIANPTPKKQLIQRSILLAVLLIQTIGLSSNIVPQYSCSKINATIDSIFANELEESDWARELTPFLYQQSEAQDCDVKEKILTLAGIFYFNDQKFDKSGIALQEADSIFTAKSVKSQIAVFAKLFLGLNELAKKNKEKALAIFKAASVLSESFDYYTGMMLASLNHAIVYTGLGQTQKAKEYLIPAIQWVEKAERKSMTGYVYLNLGSNYVKERNYQEAVKNFEIARTIWEEIGFSKGLYYVESNYVILDRERNFVESYVDHLKKAIYYLEQDSTLQRSVSYIELGFHYIKQNKDDDALYYLQKGFENHNGINEDELMGVVNNLIDLYSKKNERHNVRKVGQDLAKIYQRKINQVSNQANQWNKKEFVLESKIIENEILKKSQEEAAFKIRLRNFLLLILAITFILAGFLFNMRLKSNKLKEKLHLEQLRTKISKNLHDDVGTLLAGISYQAQTLEIETTDNKTKLIENIVKQSAEAKSLMRDMVWAMDSRKDSFMDVEFKMKDFLSDMLANSTIKCRFQNDITLELKGLDSDLKHGIYLIFKESINNIIKHSDAKKISIRLSLHNKMLRLLIQDDGSEQIIKKSGQGLQNMAERAKDLGGTYTFQYVDGYQTEVQLPVEKDF